MPPPLCGKLQRGAVKQVTKSNFRQAIEQLRDHVQDADFIAVSTQKTGSAFFPSSASSFPSSARTKVGGSHALHLGWRCVSPIDTPKMAYLKAKLAAERFELLQFAVCPFRLQGSKVIAHPYNFHLFPRDELHLGMPSYSFSCQTSIITSMAHEGFDFNVCIYDGKWGSHVVDMSTTLENFKKD
ncbi:hypothetical protein Taro_001445 [Colocasia esculenta]|uniref:Uncharacterized protein n=1 Tax=Colocasia esculenta TaxID=4460 RepID=A0A843TKQ7_COLES|nr:hypothetical protein [Colocasia esculenta]